MPRHITWCRFGKAPGCDAKLSSSFKVYGVDQCDSSTFCTTTFPFCFIFVFSTFIQSLDSFLTNSMMDTLVAWYTQSPFETEGFSQEQQDYTDSLPPLSLKFALPPIARVSCPQHSVYPVASSTLTNHRYSLLHSSAQQRTTTQTRTAR